MIETYTVELKPCPFCGNKPWGVFGPDEHIGSCWVECHGAYTFEKADINTPICGDWHYHGNRQATAEAWNKRSHDI